MFSFQSRNVTECYLGPFLVTHSWAPCPSPQLWDCESECEDVYNRGRAPEKCSAWDNFSKWGDQSYIFGWQFIWFRPWRVCSIFKKHFGESGSLVKTDSRSLNKVMRKMYGRFCLIQPDASGLSCACVWSIEYKKTWKIRPALKQGWHGIPCWGVWCPGLGNMSHWQYLKRGVCVCVWHKTYLNSQ